MLREIFTLLVAFQVKHYFCDYPLQGRWALAKFNADWSFFVPLAAHATIHAIVTLAICLAANPTLWWLALIDGVAHFVMDRIKAGPRWLGRFDDQTKPEFWWCLGLDQMVHHLTHYGIIFILLTR